MAADQSSQPGPAHWAALEDCVVCGKDDFAPGHGPRTLITCEACLDKGVHVECWHKHSGELLTEERLASPAFQWFCSESCRRVSERLVELTGVPRPLHDGSGSGGEYSVELVRWSARDKGCQRVVGHAQAIFNSAFSPLVMHNGRNLIDMVCEAYELPDSGAAALARGGAGRAGGGGSDVEEGEGGADYNFSTFRVLLLRKRGIVVSAATLRAFGPRFAEVPFVATREGYRREGHCRRLMQARELEGLLRGMGVRYVIVPAMRAVLPMWLKKLGYAQFSREECDVLEERIVMPDPSSATLVHKALQEAAAVMGVGGRSRAVVPAVKKGRGVRFAGISYAESGSDEDAAGGGRRQRAKSCSKGGAAESQGPDGSDYEASEEEEETDGEEGLHTCRRCNCRSDACIASAATGGMVRDACAQPADFGEPAGGGAAAAAAAGSSRALAGPKAATARPPGGHATTTRAGGPARCAAPTARQAVRRRVGRRLDRLARSLAGVVGAGALQPADGQEDGDEPAAAALQMSVEQLVADSLADQLLGDLRIGDGGQAAAVHAYEAQLLGAEEQAQRAAAALEAARSDLRAATARAEAAEALLAQQAAAAQAATAAGEVGELRPQAEAEARQQVEAELAQLGAQKLRLGEDRAVPVQAAAHHTTAMEEGTLWLEPEAGQPGLGATPAVPSASQGLDGAPAASKVPADMAAMDQTGAEEEGEAGGAAAQPGAAAASAPSLSAAQAQPSPAAASPQHAVSPAAFMFGSAADVAALEVVGGGPRGLALSLRAGSEPGGRRLTTGRASSGFTARRKPVRSRPAPAEVQAAAADPAATKPGSPLRGSGKGNPEAGPHGQGSGGAGGGRAARSSAGSDDLFGLFGAIDGGGSCGSTGAPPGSTPRPGRPAAIGRGAEPAAGTTPAAAPPASPSAYLDGVATDAAAAAAAGSAPEARRPPNLAAALRLALGSQESCSQGAHMPACPAHPGPARSHASPLAPLLASQAPLLADRAGPASWSPLLGSGPAHAQAALQAVDDIAQYLAD